MKIRLSIIGFILIGIVFLIMSCGSGSSGSSGGASSALTTDNAKAVAGVTLSSLRLLVDTSYLGSASLGSNFPHIKGFLISLFEESVAKGKDISGKTISASEDRTETCSGGGTRHVVSEWNGDAADARDVTSKVAYSSCREGSETWDGTLEITIQGPQSMPTSVSTVATLIYEDTTDGDMLTLTDTKVLYSNFIYKEGVSGGAQVELTGKVSGMVGGKSLDAEFNSFRMSYTLNGPDVILNLDGSINPSCVGKWISVSTYDAVTFGSGSQCPSSGKVNLTEGDSTYMFSFEHTGVGIFFKDNQVAHFGLCNDTEGLCTALK